MSGESIGLAKVRCLRSSVEMLSKPSEYMAKFVVVSSKWPARFSELSVTSLVE